MKLGKMIVIGVVAGFAIGFTEELILQATHADAETRKVVSDVTNVALFGATVGSLFI